jgi:hypothetical protein
MASDPIANKTDSRFIGLRFTGFSLLWRFNLRHSLFVAGTLSSLAFLLAGCGGGGSSNSASTLAAVTPTGKVTPFTTIQATKAGTVFYIILDRAGGKIIAPVKLVGTSDESNARQINFTISNQMVGAGDAGSLIMDNKGNLVGALSSVLGSTGSIFESTAIEDEQSILLSGPTDEKPKLRSAISNSDGTMRLVRGVSPYIWSIASKDSRNPVSKLFTLSTAIPPKIVAKPQSLKGTSYSSTIFMVSTYGDAMTAYTTGSVTATDVGKLLCLGHPLNWEGGSQNIPCYFGAVTGFIIDPIYGASKLAFPDFSTSAGTLIDDRRFGVVVDPTVTATPIPITGTITFNTNAPVTFKGQVAQDSELETAFALMNISQGTSNVIDASEVSGSATGSATVNYADGTSQTVDLTDPSSSYLIADLYNTMTIALYDPTSGAPIPLQSITFNFQITSTGPTINRHGGSPAKLTMGIAHSRGQ